MLVSEELKGSGNSNVLRNAYAEGRGFHQMTPNAALMNSEGHNLCRSGRKPLDTYVI